MSDTSNQLGTRTGAHMGVGQMATGQYESLTDRTALAEVPRTIPVVNIEPLERRRPPPTRRAWLRWAIVGAAIVLALIGVIAVASG